MPYLGGVCPDGMLSCVELGGKCKHYRIRWLLLEIFSASEKGNNGPVVIKQQYKAEYEKQRVSWAVYEETFIFCN